MLTAADVRQHGVATDGEVGVVATVGLTHPILAAAPDGARQPLVGTINVVISVPERLTDSALVNAVSTATEAKVQALSELGLDATGTATDAICVLCPGEGRPHAFGGPRSMWGSRLARAVHAAVRRGAWERHG
jgi:adenosylcobinamide amidohydrolase